MPMICKPVQTSSLDQLKWYVFSFTSQSDSPHRAHNSSSSVQLDDSDQRLLKLSNLIDFELIGELNQLKSGNCKLNLNYGGLNHQFEPRSNWLRPTNWFCHGARRGESARPV